MTRRSVAGRTAGLTAACVLAASLAGGTGERPAVAQQELEPPEASITVTSLSRVLGPGSAEVSDEPPDEPTFSEELELRVLVENDGEVPLAAAQLVVEIHPATLTRGLLANALDGELSGPAMHVHTQPLQDGGPLAPGAIAGLEDRFTRDEVDWAADAGGVHPVRIAVTLGTEVLDEVVTAVVWLNEAPSDPLLTTVVWPVDTQPWRTAGGVYPEGLERETRPGARLDRLVGAVERGPSGVPVVLSPAAHLLEDLSDRSDGYVTQVRSEDGSLESRSVRASDSGASSAGNLLRRLREVAGDQPLAPISSAYADADLAALLAGDATHAELAALTASDGRRRLQLQLGVEVDGSTHLVGAGITEDVLDVLPGETILLPADVTDLPSLGADPDLGQPVRRLQAPSGRLLTGLIGDPYLAAALDGLDHDAGSVVGSQRVLAESAMAHLASPRSADRGLVLLPDPTWDPPGATAEDLLDALGEAPWLRFTAPSRLAAEAQRGITPIGLAPPEYGPLAAPLAGELSTAWGGLEAALAASPDDTTRLQDRPVDQLRDDLLRATSRWFRGSREAEAGALVRDVSRTVEATFGDVEVISGGVTLTSDTGQIPVTLQRTRGGPLLVSVGVESQGRLLWPEGRRSEVVRLEEDGSATVSFATRAVSTGTFPVTVTVSDPSGNHELARDTVSVRSTAISRPALSATAALVVLLLLVGSLRRRPSPPEEPPRLAVVRDTGSDEVQGGS